MDKFERLKDIIRNKKNDFNTINLIQTLMKPLFMFIILFIFAHSSVYASDDSQKIEETARYVLSQATIPTISSTSGEWAVIGISHSGLNVPDSYFDSYNARVSNILDEKNGNLGRKYTEYSRIAIALNSIGAPTSNIGEKRFNLFSYINDYDKVILQGISVLGGVDGLPGHLCAARKEDAAGGKARHDHKNEQNKNAHDHQNVRVAFRRSHKAVYCRADYTFALVHHLLYARPCRRCTAGCSLFAASSLRRCAA